MERPVEKNAQFTIRLPQELKDEMQASAKKQDIDAVTWLRHAIREKLDREGQGRQATLDIVVPGEFNQSNKDEHVQLTEKALEEKIMSVINSMVKEGLSLEDLKKNL